MSTDFREARREARESKIADRMEALRAAPAAAKKAFVQTIRRPIEVGEPIPGMAVAKWQAPVVPDAVQQEHFDAYGWSMSAEDQEMVAVGLNPNDPEDCRRWDARKRGVDYAPRVTPGNSRNIPAQDPGVVSEERMTAVIGMMLKKVFTKLGVDVGDALEEPPPPPAPAAGTPTVNVEGWD